MFKPSTSQKNVLRNGFLIALLTASLSACPSQTVGQSVNITIDKQLIEQITGVAPPNGSSAKNSETPSVSTPASTPPSSTEDSGTLDDESLSDDEALFEVVYDVANGLNDWDIFLFSNALHPNSAFAANMPGFFNQLVEVGTTHQINNIAVEERSESSAMLRVNRYSTAFGSGKTEDLYYDLLKVSGEWKLLQIRSVDGSF